MRHARVPTLYLDSRNERAAGRAKTRLHESNAALLARRLPGPSDHPALAGRAPGRNRPVGPSPPRRLPALPRRQPAAPTPQLHAHSDLVPPGNAPDNPTKRLLDRRSAPTAEPREAAHVPTAPPSIPPLRAHKSRPNPSAQAASEPRSRPFIAAKRRESVPLAPRPRARSSSAPT